MTAPDTATMGKEPRCFAVFDAVWAKHGAEDEWVITSHMLRNGDLFIALSLLESFRQIHAPKQRIRLIASTKTHASICAMFGHVIDSVHIASELAAPRVEDLMAWMILRGRDRFAPGGLLMLQPWVLALPPIQLQPLVNTTVLSYTGLLKLVLRLPASAAPIPPPISRDDRVAAQELLRAERLSPGRTLVLFPYAQSFHLDWFESLALLAAEARAAGWQVVTSCVGQETPVPGTAAVNIPFGLLRPVCEAAGQAVSIRSGISDMLAQVTCRHVVLYGSAGMLNVWGLQSMGLGGASAEVALDPATQAPAETAARIWSLLTQPDDSGQAVSPPRDVVSMLDLFASGIAAASVRGAEPDGPALRIGVSRPHQILRQATAYPGLILTDGWMNEDWGAWSHGGRAVLWLRAPAWAKRLAIFGHGAVNEAYPDLHMTVVLGRMRHAATIRWPLPSPSEPLFILPLPAGLRPDRPLLVEFEIRNPQSPALLSDGANPDLRPLGLALRGVSFI